MKHPLLILWLLFNFSFSGFTQQIKSYKKKKDLKKKKGFLKKEFVMLKQWVSSIQPDYL